MKKKKLRIRAVSPEIASEIGWYIPSSNTVYYTKTLDKHPELKKFVIDHEIKHSIIFNNMSNKEFITSLGHELKDQVRMTKPENIKRILRLTKAIIQEQAKILRLQKRNVPSLLIYSIVYRLFNLFLGWLVAPVYIYYSIKTRTFRYYVYIGWLGILIWVWIIIQVLKGIGLWSF